MGDNHLDPKNFTWAALREHLIFDHQVDPVPLDDERWDGEVHRRRRFADVLHEEAHGG